MPGFYPMRWSVVVSCAAIWCSASWSSVSCGAEPAAGPQRAVSEALQREVYGLSAERTALLQAALIQSPEFAPARWQQGYVKDDRRGWLRYDELLKVSKFAARIAAYERERARTEDNVAGNLALADWCAAEMLTAQDRAHLTRVLDLSPDHALARERLGFVRQNGQWVSRGEMALEQSREESRRSSLAKWKPVLEKIRADLEHRSQARQEFARGKLLQISDPSVIPALEEVFRGAADDVALVTVELLGTISDPEASVSLSRFAVYWPAPAVRAAAAQALQARDQDTYVPQLVSSMYSPVVSRFMATSLPGGRIGYRHAFVREGEDERQVLLFDTEYSRISLPGGSRRDSTGRAFADAAGTAGQLEATARAQNQVTTALNDRLAWVLGIATGADLPAQPEAWWRWWNEQNEVFLQGDKPTNIVQRTRRVAIVDRTLQDPGGSGDGGGSGGGSGSQAAPRLDCLAAGTPVWTLTGPVDIEKVRVGDLVLSQHPETGELAYKPVLRTTVRPSGKLVEVAVRGETFQTSGGHLFWVSGEGWKKARSLESGQVLHSLSGPVHVSPSDAQSEAETYNLVVADFSTYFVGQAMLLSHDNTVRQPTRALVPGLPLK
jgi:hypothetical protein